MDRHTVQIAITAVIVIVVFALRMRRMGQSRPLRLEQLWIVPAIFAGFAALTLLQAPPQPSDLPWLAAAALIGGVIGWYRGKMMRISVDPQTHALNQVASPAAMIFLLAVFALRYGIRYALGAEAQAWGISLNLLADAPMLLVVGMFAVTRVEMYLRAQRLLSEARAAKAGQGSRP